MRWGSRCWRGNRPDIPRSTLCRLLCAARPRMPVLSDQHRGPRWCRAQTPPRHRGTVARTRTERVRSAAPNWLPSQHLRKQRYDGPPQRNADIPRRRRRPEKQTVNERRVNPRPDAYRCTMPSARARAPRRRHSSKDSDPSHIPATRVYRGFPQASASQQQAPLVIMLA